MLFNLKPIFPFLLLFGVVYTPQLGSYDIIGPQWLILGIVVCFFYFTNLSKFSLKQLRSPILYVYVAFIFFAFISGFYSRNFTLYLHDFSRLIIVFVLALLFAYFLKHKKVSFKNISLLISFLLLVEVIYSLSPIIAEFYYNGLKILEATSINLMSLRGVTGNKNIAAASIAIKSVFAIYLLFISNRTLTKFLLSILISFSTLSLFMLSARAALLSFLIVFISYIFYGFSIAIINRKFSSFLSVIFLIVTVSISFLFSNLLIPNEDITVVNRISNIEFTNESSSKRLELWEGALDFISSNPIIGCGLGNWKIESAYYMRNSGADYLVPYHAHNDFLEMTTELGLLGGLLYFLLFTFAAFKLLKSFLTSNFNPMYLALICGLIVYTIDALLNFPIERPIMQIPFALILGFVIHEYSKSRPYES